MGDLTPHFSSHEFRSRDGASREIDCRLLAMLEGIRAALGGVPVSITSGYRSPAHNRAVGGAPDSYHVRGMAADIQVAGVSPQRVYEVADRLYPISGLGVYQRDGGWVHIDSRGSRARWAG